MLEIDSDVSKRNALSFEQWQAESQKNDGKRNDRLSFSGYVLPYSLKSFSAKLVCVYCGKGGHRKNQLYNYRCRKEYARDVKSESAFEKNEIAKIQTVFDF